MTTLLILATVVLGGWFVVSLSRRGGGASRDATADFSRAMAALSPPRPSVSRRPRRRPGAPAPRARARRPHRSLR